MYKRIWRSPHKKLFLLVGIILLAASFLRLYKIADYMTFLGDEGRDALVVRDIIEGVGDLFKLDFKGAQDKITFLGPTASVGGFFMGPIYYYFMAPFLWLFNYDPVGPAVMVALFGIATVFLIYKIGREFFGKTTGIIASLLYTIAPLPIAYSRSSWNPNLMPFFSLLIMYVVYKGIAKNSLKYMLICGILYGVALQLHYVELFLGIAVVLYIILNRAIHIFIEKTIPIFRLTKDYLYLFIGFLIGWSPFLLFEITHNFTNIQSIIKFVFSSGETGGGGNFFGTIWNVFFRLFARLVFNYPPPEQLSLKDSLITFNYFFGSFQLPVRYAFYIVLIAAIASTSVFLYQFYKNISNKKEFQKYSFVLLWFATGIFIFGFYKKQIYDYYFQFMFPLPFFLVGNFIATLFHANLKPPKIIALVLFAWLIFVNIIGIPFRHMANRQKQQVQMIAEFVLSKADGKPFNFGLITGGNSDHAYRYFFRLKKTEPIPIENLQKDPNRKTVTNQLLVVCETVPCHPLGDSTWEIAGFGRAEIAGEWKISVVKVYKLVPYNGKE